jgi:hypothetical protein
MDMKLEVVVIPVAGTAARVPGLAPDRKSYGSFASFSDPAGPAGPASAGASA